MRPLGAIATHLRPIISASTFSASTFSASARPQASPPRVLRNLATMPDQKSFKYVVLGCGNAAGYAAREFVQCGVAAGELALVGDEPELPYERPALSKAVLTNPAVRLPGFHTCVGGGGERQNRDFYDTHGIALLTSTRVKTVDLESKTLTADDGTQVVAETALILATGADPIRLDRMPGGTLKNVLYLRNNVEALELADQLAAHKDKDVLVVGGGYIGMEVAAAAATVGCKVTMVFPEEHLMPRLFTPEIAHHYEAVYAGLGVKMLKNGRVCKAFLDDGSGSVRGATVCTQDGASESEVSASLVVVGVGARAATALFPSDAIEKDERGGVIVNENMQTSAPDVYAVGDIATFPLALYGNRATRVEHVGHARSSASQAVRTICGADCPPYDYLPFFYSRAASVAWKFYGDNPSGAVVVGDFRPKLAAFFYDGPQVVGVFCEKPSDDDSALMATIARTKPEVPQAAVEAAGSVDAAFSLFKK